MKQAAVLGVMLAIATWGVAQTYNQNQSAPKNPPTQPGNNQPGTAQQGIPQPPGTAAPAPTGKRPPQAKTQPEFDAYKAAAALTDPAAQEKAADDFAAKFADSELRAVLYKSAMHGYQQANNADKMMDMSRKVLNYDADDPEALLGVAQVLAERTRDTDLDKDQRLAEAKKNAQRALSTVETDIPT